MCTDQVGWACRTHLTEICRQWWTVGALYQTHHGIWPDTSLITPSARHSSPALYIYRTHGPILASHSNNTQYILLDLVLITYHQKIHIHTFGSLLSWLLTISVLLSMSLLSTPNLTTVTLCYNLPKSQINRLQQIQHCLARENALLSHHHNCL